MDTSTNLIVVLFGQVADLTIPVHLYELNSGVYEIEIPLPEFIPSFKTAAAADQNILDSEFTWELQLLQSSDGAYVSLPADLGQRKPDT